MSAMVRNGAVRKIVVVVAGEATIHVEPRVAAQRVADGQLGAGRKALLERGVKPVI